MSQTPDFPDGVPDPEPRPRGSASSTPLPGFEEVPPEEFRRGAIDFSYANQGEPSAPKPAKSIDPANGGSLVSWAELLRQSSRSEDEIALGSLPELQINAVSDNDIIKSLEREAGRSGILHQIAGGSSKRLRGEAGPKSGKRLGVAPPLETPPPPPPENLAEAKDWFRDLDDNGSAVDLMTAAREAAQSLKDSGQLEKNDETDVLASALHLGDGTSAVNLGMEPQASALMSSIGALPAHLRPTIAPPPAVTPRPVRRPPSRANLHLPRPRRLTSWLGGAALGAASVATLGIGLWVGGIIPQSTVPSGEPLAVKPELLAAPVTPISPAATSRAANRNWLSKRSPAARNRPPFSPAVGKLAGSLICGTSGSAKNLSPNAMPKCGVLVRS